MGVHLETFPGVIPETFPGVNPGVNGWQQLGNCGLGETGCPDWIDSLSLLLYVGAATGNGDPQVRGRRRPEPTAGPRPRCPPRALPLPAVPYLPTPVAQLVHRGLDLPPGGRPLLRRVPMHDGLPSLNVRVCTL